MGKNNADQHKQSQPKKSKNPFVLEGQCVGFVVKDECKIKALRLATPAQEVTIKLPKSVRRTLEPTAWLGARLGIAGRCKLDPETGAVKYKAEEVAVLTPPTDLPPFTVAERPSVPPPDAPDAPPKKAATILVCNKSKCCKRGGSEVVAQLERELGDRHLSDQVKIKRTGCMKQCKAGPNLVMPDKTRYSRIQAADVPELVEKHF
ncbi:MAG: (2Fe-2S) ferredoxin domain-containing protein [Synechococcales bacterium]|nr:(2Fe-2S) ferredoxin domain-containing protein [Synechococcales bacterium]